MKRFAPGLLVGLALSVSWAARAQTMTEGVPGADAGVEAPDAPEAPQALEEAPSPVAAELPDAGTAEPPARVRLSNWTLVSYHLDNGNIAPPGSPNFDPTGNNYVDWLNKLQLDASWRELTAQVRVDSAVYVNAPVAAPGDVRLEQLLQRRYSRRVDFEKARVTYASRNLDVTLGDTYVTFGRGLVLALRKVDEFGVDTTSRGISITGRVAGLTAQGLAGFSNIVNVDPATGRYAEDPGDGLLGARVEYRFGRWVTPGFNVSHVAYAQNLGSGVAQASRDTVTSFSGTLELPYLGRWGKVYAEYAMQRRITAGSTLWSHAMYATASAYLGRVTLLLEFKDYADYSAVPTSLDPTLSPELALTNFYTAAPTLERVQQLVLNNTDVIGGHARASLKVAPGVVPFVSMAGFYDRIYQTNIFDPYAGAELRWNDGASRASISGGYRLSQYGQGSVQPGALFQSAAHAELDIIQHLKGPLGLEVSGLHVTHVDAQGPNFHTWHEGQAYLSLKSAQSWSAAVGYEYYSEAPLTIRTHYVNASGSWTVFKNLTARLFIGGQRAGIKCVNGVCRNYPAFDGARVEVLAKY